MSVGMTPRLIHERVICDSSTLLALVIFVFLHESGSLFCGMQLDGSIY